MAKFCVNCGKPLEEGEVCNCQAQEQQPSAPQQAPVQYAAPQMPVQQPMMQQQAPVQQYAPQQPAPGQQYIPQQPAAPAQPAAPSPVGIYFKSMWETVLGIVKAPATGLKSFAASGDYKTAIGFIAAYSILLSLFALVFFKRISFMFTSALSYFSDANIELPMAKIFFMTLILTAGLAFLFAAFLLLFNKSVFKAETTYLKMLCVASAKSLAVAPFIIVAILISFINMTWGAVFVGLGMLLSYFFVAAAVKGASEIDDDKALYTAFLSFAALAVATFIFIRVGYTSYLPF